MDLIPRLAAEFKLDPVRIGRTLALLDEGATVPFIARYRKEQTGNLDETKIREIERRRKYLAELEERRAVVLKSIESQGRLTPELEKAVLEAAGKTELEDLYLPFRPKRETRASKAREAGLEPLALWLEELSETEADFAAEGVKYVAPDKGIETPDQALAGARDILAEKWADDAEARKALRALFREDGVVVSSLRPECEGKATKFETYRNFRETVTALPSHRALALFRGEREKALKLEFAYPKAKAVRDLVYRFIRRPKSAAAPLLVETVIDALDRLLAPAVETETRRNIRERAEAEAFGVFGANLRDLLLAPPAGRRPVLGLDPGFRTGCKLAAVDAASRFLEYRTVFPNEPKNDLDGAKRALLEMVCEHASAIVAIGNGTASRETERFVRDALAELPEARRPITVVVSEAGASVYSASEAAVREFPKLDVTVRGAISIARRIQDPLAELVKIEPRSIGVGQYQHDVDQAGLQAALGEVVESCVNAVGVDLNLASEALLRYVSGLNRATAAAIVRHRAAQGPFRSRTALREVKGVGEKTYEQAAGFLRVPGAENPLDDSAVHPERYALVEHMALELETTVREIIGNIPLLRSVDPRRFASDEAGVPTIRDILAELEKPGRDPRAEFRTAVFSETACTVADLSPGQILEGTVTNVTNFGAFVDIGVHQDGLVHLSELAEKFVRDPRTVVRVGQVVKVRVIGIDAGRKRIGLSLKKVR